MALTKEEKETIITFDESNDTATIYTHTAHIQRQMEQLAAQRPDRCSLVRCFEGGAAEYNFPKKWFRIYPERILTADARAALAERLKCNLAKNQSI